MRTFSVCLILILSTLALSESPAPEVKPETKSVTVDPRYSAGEPDYNSEQRENWLKTCEKFKNKDLQSYRKCFQDEKAKSKEALRQSFDEVERRQSLPLRNVNPLLDEQERNVNGQEDE